MFCGLKLGRLAQPQLTQDGIALVASNEDLLASKLRVILQRAEALKALVFFEDGDLGSLPLSTRQQLQTAVSQLGPLPPPPT